MRILKCLQGFENLPTAQSFLHLTYLSGVLMSIPSSLEDHILGALGSDTQQCACAQS